MKRKFLTKCFAVCMCAAMSLTVVGCGSKNIGEKETDSTVITSEVTSKETPEQTSEMSEITTTSEENEQYMNTASFYPISTVAEAYTLSCEYMTDEEDAQFSGTVYGGKTFKGEYALSSNESDKIVVADYERHKEAYIEVNGVKKDIVADHIEKVGIVDVDISDSYKEIVLYDLGASEDPTLIIFRYCDGTIYELGSFYGVYSYDSVLFDKNGKIIDACGYVDFVEPQIVTEYYKVTNNAAASVKVDYDDALNKTYKLVKDMTVAFCETDNENVEDASININDTVDIKVGEEIQLIKAEPSQCLYYVQLPDGRKGVITTQLAG